MMNILSYSFIALPMSGHDVPGNSVNYVLFALLVFTMSHYLWLLRKSLYYEQKFRFCRNAVHRSTNALMVIKTILESLATEDLAPSASIALRRMAGYIDDAMNFNHSIFLMDGEEKVDNFNTHAYDLYMYITSVINHCREYAENHHVKLNVCKGTEYRDCSINDVAFTTALQSLIERVIRSTPRHGSVHIIVSCTNEEWSLEIFNSLPTAEDYKQPWGLLITQMKMRFCGNLRFIARMVRLHSGELTGYESGRSVHYKMTLPLYSDDNWIVEADFNAENLPHVLLVTEDKELSVYLKKHLSCLCRISVTEHYAEVPRCLSDGDTDIVLIDGTREGMELCSKIKSSKQTSDVAVVMLTDFDDAKVNAAIEECEADCFLPRMVHSDRLRTEFRAFIEERTEQRAFVVKLVHADFSAGIPQDIIINEKDAATVQKLNTLLEKHLSDEYQLRKLAKDMGVCRTILYQEVKRITKVSPTHYIFTFKMERAGRLMLTGEYKVNEIATLVGYGTGEYFTKRFRKYHGVAPRGYLKREGKLLRPC